MTDQHGVVIIGGGYGGGETAIKLRQGGYTGPITLISAETHPPYHRPPLSKAYLAGELAEEALLIRPQTAYDKANITLRLNTRVTAIDRAGQQITIEGGEKLPYAELVLATGGEARALACPGSNLRNVFTLRHRGDAAAIRPLLREGQKLVVIGGGYIGLEVAAVAAKHGLSVTVLEAAPRLLARVAGPELGGFFARVHHEAGVKIFTDAMVCALEPSAADPDQVGQVVLEDGLRFAADFVLAGIGLVPSTGLAQAAGLKVDNGIMVDEHCCTEDAHIYAIGDVANHFCPPLGQRVRLESVPNALEQARVCAAWILGSPAPYSAMPWFWSDQYDLKLQSVGISQGYDRAVIRGDFNARNVAFFYLRAGKLIAADVINRAAEFMVAKKLVSEKICADPAKLADETQPLKALLT